MFQIFDCNGRAVGRPQGYAKHRTAVQVVNRPGRVKTAVWTAFHLASPDRPGSRRLVYKILYWPQTVDMD